MSSISDGDLTGSGLDDATLAAIIADSQTGSGTDNDGVVSSVSTDTGTGSENTAAFSKVSLDTGASAEVASMALANIDTGSGLDASALIITTIFPKGFPQNKWLLEYQGNKWIGYVVKGKRWTGSMVGDHGY